MGSTDVSTGPRLALLAPAGASLLVGLNAGLLLAAAPAPWSAARLEGVHGVLMVAGFLGTVIALERAVALRHPLGYAAPGFLGLGGVALTLPLPTAVGQVLIVNGMVALLLVYAALWQRSRDDTVAVQAAGAFHALLAVSLWGRVELSAVVGWLIGFVVLTIAAERVELARISMPPAAAAWLSAHAAILTATLTLDLVVQPWGRVAFGAELVAIVVWLVRHDVARRTVRARGLPRFSAVALLAGYGWLATAGVAWAVEALARTDHPHLSQALYDVGVHAAFLGFAMSMVVAHAPVILPAVLRRPLPYRSVLWIPLVALHAALGLRLGAAVVDGMGAPWRAGIIATVVALLSFVLVTAASVVATPHRRSKP